MMTPNVPHTVLLIKALALASIVLLLPTFAIGAVVDKVLVPIVARDVPGAHGSIWSSRIVLFNGGGELVSVHTSYGCPLGTCAPSFFVDPGTSMSPHLIAPSSTPGLFMYITKPSNVSLAINSRIQDISRQSLTWGTDVPIVWERDALAGTAHIVDVPLEVRFRRSLRIYGFNRVSAADVRVRVFAIETGALLSEHILTLEYPPQSEDGPFVPGYASMLDLDVPTPEGAIRARIELQPLSEELRYWGFVSVTNNETQHVTLVTP
jgi:hypothetical protein